MIGRQPLQVLVDKVLDGPLASSPFFWGLPGSRRGAPSWAFGYTTMEDDREARGSVRVIKVCDAKGEAAPNWAPGPVAVPAGTQSATGDIDGDGGDELVVVDIEGRVHAFTLAGGSVQGFPTAVSTSRILACPPVIRDLNGDDRVEIALLSREIMAEKSAGVLAVYDGTGRVRDGFPVTLETPPGGALILAEMGGQRRAVVGWRGGSICAVDAAGGALLASMAAPGASSRALAAADLDGDGTDEIIYATGAGELACVDPSGGAPVADWPFIKEGAAFVGLAAGTPRGGRPVVCAYDKSGGRFVLLGPGSPTRWTAAVEGAQAKVLVRLVASEPLGRESTVYFAAVLFEPTADRNIDAVFEENATPEMRDELAKYEKARRKDYASAYDRDWSQEYAGDVRECKVGLLIDHLGEKKAVELLESPMATELWVFNSRGASAPGFPVRVTGVQPFFDVKANRAAVVSMLYDEQARRALLLMGFNDALLQTGRVCVYALE